MEKGAHGYVFLVLLHLHFLVLFFTSEFTNFVHFFYKKRWRKGLKATFFLEFLHLPSCFIFHFRFYQNFTVFFKQIEKGQFYQILTIFQ